MAGAAVPPTAALQRESVQGGAVATDPVVNGHYVYIATGLVLTTWNYRNARLPIRLASATPVDGPINALSRYGDYLYASWRGYDGTSGVAVYSIASPGQPVLLAQYDEYVAADDKFATGLVVANQHLYLFDNNYGVFVGDLANPAAPVFAPTGIPAGQYTRIVAHGNTIHATGRNFIGSTTLDLIDVSQPTAPAVVANHAVDGFDSFSLTPEPAQAIGVGYRLTMFDLSNPVEIVPRGALDINPALRGLRVGDYYYGFGYDNGMDIWNIANIDAPQAIGHLETSTLGARHAAVVGDTALLLSGTDLVQALSTRTPARPKLVSSNWIPGGSAATDIAPLDGQVILSQPNYGFTINDARTLAPLARFEADLPATVQERDFEQIAVAGHLVYLTAWGYGLIVVDVSDPLHPLEVGRLPFPFADVIEVHGDYAYLAKATDGDEFAVVRVSRPGDMEIVARFPLDATITRLRVHGNYAFASGGALDVPGSGGRVYDLADPAHPIQVATFGNDCGSAYDLAIDAAMSLLYLACEEGMQVIDIEDPETPTLIGAYATGVYSLFTKVEQRNDRAWYADYQGLHELDVSDPTTPILIKKTRLGGQEARRMHMLGNGMLLVLGGTTGVHVFRAPRNVRTISSP